MAVVTFLGGVAGVGVVMGTLGVWVSSFSVTRIGFRGTEVVEATTPTSMGGPRAGLDCFLGWLSFVWMGGISFGRKPPLRSPATKEEDEKVNIFKDLSISREGQRVNYSRTCMERIKALPDFCSHGGTLLWPLLPPFPVPAFDLLEQA